MNRPLAHDSLARVFDITLTAKRKDLPLETLNTILRGQVILGSDISGDIQAVNGMIRLGAYLKTMPLGVKKQTMQGIVAPSIATNHSFGVSYTGKISWGGMEKYVRDVHVYAGEMKRSGSLSIEIFTIGSNFSICLMQPGKNPLFAEKLIDTFRETGIDCVLTGKGRFCLPDFRI